MEDLLSRLMSSEAMKMSDIKEAKHSVLVTELKKHIVKLTLDISDRDKRILNLERDCKITTLFEHKNHIKALEEECVRLRKRTEQAIRFSKEVDYERMQRNVL